MPASPSSTPASSCTSIDGRSNASRLIRHHTRCNRLASLSLRQFLPHHHHFRRRIDPNPHYAAVDFHQRNRDVIAQLNPFADLAGEHQHDCTPLRPLTRAATESRFNCGRFSTASTPLQSPDKTLRRSGKTLTLCGKTLLQ